MIGHGVPVYRGYASQYGHGLGNVLGGIFRSTIPFIAPVIKSAGKQLLLTGAKKIQQKLETKKEVKRVKHKPHTVKRKRKNRPRDIFS